ncbi:MAG: RluA family pseudouridine synthase [Candidatus Omnitrophica bacterium]|nr:RluA family pseudouridine synthase [Candidatus Omnitrophota bacterium]MDD5593043.1 RluA family pseudouridine synthase [Candidatus Omnitrophota bacterium]
MQEYTLSVSDMDAGKRLDLFLADFFKKENLGVSRTFIQKAIAEGGVAIKGAPLVKPHLKVKSGDEIRIVVENRQHADLKAEEIPLDVVYEDDDLAVINKLPGLVVHPAPGNYEHTLVNALLHRFKKLSDINPERPGIVHRLDKDTSGLLVIAKNNTSHLDLARQFAKHSIKRKYIALVRGRMEFDENVIELPIGRHPHKRKNMSVGFGKNTKYAKTYYRTLKRKQDFSLLELEPFTGRTHQLRVHLAFLGHPVLGDAKYGNDNEFSRLALHARYIGFMHPRMGKFMEFSCDVPPEFTRFINK